MLCYAASLLSILCVTCVTPCYAVLCCVTPCLLPESVYLCCLCFIAVTQCYARCFYSVVQYCLCVAQCNLSLSHPITHHTHTQGSSGTSQPPSLPPATSFPIVVDMPELWLPSNWSSHREWVTKLVTTIISSGGVTDEVLLLLKPVCQVQVSQASCLNQCVPRF